MGETGKILKMGGQRERRLKSWMNLEKMGGLTGMGIRGLAKGLRPPSIKDKKKKASIYGFQISNLC